MTHIIHYYQGPLSSSTRMLQQAKAVADDTTVTIIYHHPEKISADSEEWAPFHLTHVPMRPYSGQIPFLIRNFNRLINLCYEFRAWSHLLRSSADILHTHQYNGIGAGLFWARLGRPVIYDAHDATQHEKHLIKQFRRVRALERKLVKRAKAVLMPSEGLTKFYQEIYPDANVRFLPSLPPRSAVGEVAGEVAHADAKLRLIYAGQISPTRLPLAAIDMVGSVPGAVLDIYGYVAGESDHRSCVEDHIREKGIEGISFKGRYDSSAIVDIMRGYDFLLLPYPTDQRNYQYCMPNKFFQALAARLPLIVTNIAELGGIVREWDIGLVSESDDMSDLASKLPGVDRDQEPYLGMKRSMDGLATNMLDYDKYHQTLLGLYLSCCPERPAV